MAAATITNKWFARVPKDIDRSLLKGTAGGAGTVTIPHLLGGIPRAAFVQPCAGANVSNITADVTSVDATNVVFEVSAACDFWVLVFSEGPWTPLLTT